MCAETEETKAKEGQSGKSLPKTLFLHDKKLKTSVIPSKPPREQSGKKRSVGGSNVMKMGVTTQLASQAKLSENTSCVGYSTTKVMKSE